MHTPIALTIYVSLAVASFAEGPDPVRQANPEWATVYEAGLAASQRRSNEEALGFYERSWKASGSAAQRGATAAGMGEADRQLGRIREAKEWLERARQTFSTDPRLASNLTATTAKLAELYRSTDDYTIAERLLREMLVSPLCDPQSRGMIRNNLADLLREEGRSAEAQPLFIESIGIGAPWKQRAGALIGLADIDRENGDWQASINRWNEAIEICRRERDERTEAVALNGLGTTWLKAGELARAEPLLRRSLRMMEDNPDTSPEQIASAHSGLAELYRSENKLALAEDECSRALRIDRTALGDAHPQVAVLMEMLADVYSARREFGLARDYATQASNAMRTSFGEKSMPVAAALTNQAAVEQRASALDAAAQDYERAVEIVRVHPEYRWFQAVLLQRYAQLLKVMHRSREAKALAVEARSFLAK